MSLFQVYGLDKVAPSEMEAHLASGGRFVYFEYCISLIAVTLRRRTKVLLLRPGESSFLRGVPPTLLSLLLGWWGVPWGLIYTPLVVLTNLSGGCDITAEVRANLPLAANP